MGMRTPLKGSRVRPRLSPDSEETGEAILERGKGLAAEQGPGSARPQATGRVSRRGRYSTRLPGLTASKPLVADTKLSAEPRGAIPRSGNRVGGRPWNPEPGSISRRLFPCKASPFLQKASTRNACSNQTKYAFFAKSGFSRCALPRDFFRLSADVSVVFFLNIL